MNMSTNLYEQINEALKPIYLTEDEFSFLEMSIEYWQDKEIYVDFILKSNSIINIQYG